MSYYSNDRKFTNYVHDILAIPIIYQALQWQQEDINPELLEKLDINNGIDYLFSDSLGHMLTVQERFRDSKYAIYSDFTIRYRRPHNADITRHNSEFFKLEAKYMVYGITNGSKNNFNSLNNFIKYAVINLEELYNEIDNGSFIFQKGIDTCIIQNEKIICPIKSNWDQSSNFVAFDIPLIHSHLNKNNIIIKQKGFY